MKTYSSECRSYRLELSEMETEKLLDLSLRLWEGFCESGKEIDEKIHYAFDGEGNIMDYRGIYFNLAYGEGVTLETERFFESRERRGFISAGVRTLASIRKRGNNFVLGINPLHGIAIDYKFLYEIGEEFGERIDII